MKRLSQFLVLALVVGGGVAALASAKTWASSANAPEPRLGDWSTLSSGFSEVTLRVQRVQIETRVADGTRVTVTREDYFRLVDFTFDPRLTENCPAEFRDVRIESGGNFTAESLYLRLTGEVLNHTTIKLKLSGPGDPYARCGGGRTTGEVELHPVG